jgi:hypothetical protein
MIGIRFSISAGLSDRVPRHRDIVSTITLSPAGVIPPPHEARRIAANIAKLPKLLRPQD